ncbi:hypothetical protein DERF_014559 [Dermatophagoides farinae]|uniref:Uncharacterized protein n=1 Tax=Dermatophagoides farinae TaxID=6954 RepID=A0A922HML6_DERFA|nr:hypothetical protein DERF_014559 [Dermatophagoides farinae]
MSKKFVSELMKRIQEHLNECQSNLRQIETEKMYWKIKYQESQVEIEKLQNANENLKKENEKLGKRISSLKQAQHLEQEQQKLSQQHLEEENTSLLDKYQQMFLDSQDSNAEIEKLEKDSEKLEESRNEVHNLENDSEKLKESRRKVKNLQKTIARLNEKLEKSESLEEMDTIKKENARLKQQIIALEKKYDSDFQSYHLFPKPHATLNPYPAANLSEDNILHQLETIHNISTDIFKIDSFSFNEARRLEREMLSQCSSSWWEKRNVIVYFLIDPLMVINLQPKNDSSLDSGLIDPRFFFQFISSIFYVCQGLKDRPYDHFKKALNERLAPTSLDPSPKIQRNFKFSLWDRFIQPIIFNAYENLPKEEAFMYEAMIIETIGLKNLTNKACGTKLKKLNMNTRQRKVLGTFLMCKIFMKFGSKFGITVFAGN